MINVLLEIEPYHDVHGNCLEDIFATLARWKNREYIMMYANAWDFGYFPPDDKKTLLGRRISTNRDGIKYIGKKYLLNKYVGIDMTEHDIQTPEQALERIKEANDRGLPVAIFINGFWCDWNSAFKKYDISHYCMVVEINTNDMICVDPFFNRKNVSLPLDNYMNGFGNVLVFDFLDQYNMGHWSEVVDDCVKNTLHGTNGKSDFQNIRLFAEEIMHTSSLKDEFDDCNQIEASPLLLCINSIGLARKKNARVFFYFYSQYKIKALNIFGVQLDKAYARWLSIKNLLIKYSITQYSKKYLSKIYKQIYEVAAYEENLAHEIVQYLKANIP